MNSNAKRVAIVIVNWNGWRECIECLDTLFAQSHPNFHVFVIDNDSSDGSIEHIASWCKDPKRDPSWRAHEDVRHYSDSPDSRPINRRLVDYNDRAPLQMICDDVHLTLVRSGANRGFAGGCNVGINVAGLVNFEYFWFLNADTVVASRALVELVNRADGAGIGMVGSTIRYYDAPDVIQAMGGASLNRSNGTSQHIGEGASLSDVPSDTSGVERRMDYVMGASMLVSARYIDVVGLMEEDYFLYFEEVDWALRGRDKFSLGFASRSHVFHKWGVNSHKAMPLFSAQFYYRNRLRFAARFLPDRVSAVKRALFEQMLRHIARGRWRVAGVVLSTLISARTITASAQHRD
jgi:GT2 family glycosyltransferase